uniref:fibroblast growth factor 1-like n=1 Tax=Myxine glutinosa TaxID=7769 RepID=UPI00359022F8
MDVGSITTLPPSGGFPLSGNYKDPKRLYCRSGGHLLQLFPDGSVRGTQDRGDPHALLKLQAVRPGVVFIRGVSTGLYLAMNESGKLHGVEHVSDECYFQETLEENHYSSYRSEKFTERGWYVGLKRNGKVKPGPKTAWGQKAVLFLPLHMS